MLFMTSLFLFNEIIHIYVVNIKIISKIFTRHHYIIPVHLSQSYYENNFNKNSPFHTFPSIIYNAIQNHFIA